MLGSIKEIIFKSINVTNIWEAIKWDKKGRRGDGCSIRNIFESKFPEYSRLIHHDSSLLFSKFGTITNFSYETNISTNRCKNNSRMHRVNWIDTVSSSRGLFSLEIDCENEDVISFVLFWFSVSIFFNKFDPLKKFDNDSMPEESSLLSVDEAEETPDDEVGDENLTKFVVRVLSLPF